MDFEYLPKFHGAYLEDSYFLGMMAEGRDLRLKLLLALTVEHPDYTTPIEGEQHCYREGSILFRQPSEIELVPGKMTVLKDLDGSFDFGSIEVYRYGLERFRLVTEWFEAILVAEHAILEVV